jgi:hypothetical protein
MILCYDSTLTEAGLQIFKHDMRSNAPSIDWIGDLDTKMFKK